MSKLSDSKVITCKAVVCWGIGEALKLEEIKIEPPKSTEVRVKILYASVCHTDLLYTKGFPVPAFPRVLGHEGVGVVESVGEEVTDVKAGDFVIPTYVAQCEDCENCVSGKTNLCLKNPIPLSGLMTDGTSRMSARGQRLYHTISCSTWSEYMVVDAIYVLKIDPSIIDLPHASFLSCGFSTGFGAAWKEAGVERGSSVAVLGLGAVGLGAVEGARKQGAARIIGIDKNERKRIKGKAFGMTDFINPDKYDHKSISQLVKELTYGTGVDYCFECTGAPPLINESLLAIKMGKGQAIVIGAGNYPTVEISSQPLLLGGTLKGSIFGGLKAKTDLPVIIDKCKNKVGSSILATIKQNEAHTKNQANNIAASDHEIQLDELLSHEISLEDADKVFDLIKHPDCVKILIKL